MSCPCQEHPLLYGVATRISTNLSTHSLEDRIESSIRYGDDFVGKAKIMAHRLWANVLRQIEVHGFQDEQWTHIPPVESGTVAVRNP